MSSRNPIKPRDLVEINLAVEGWPPKKSEAKSLLAWDHPDSDSVVFLLRAVALRLSESRWDPTEARPVGLELIVIAQTPEQIPGDATNYLGGVADVLQADKPRRVDLTHLGDLAKGCLYRNDRQLREVRYTVESGDVPGYRVRIWVL